MEDRQVSWLMVYNQRLLLYNIYSSFLCLLTSYSGGTALVLHQFPLLSQKLTPISLNLQFSVDFIIPYHILWCIIIFMNQLLAILSVFYQKPISRLEWLPSSLLRTHHTYHPY